MRQHDDPAAGENAEVLAEPTVVVECCSISTGATVDVKPAVKIILMCSDLRKQCAIRDSNPEPAD